MTWLNYHHLFYFHTIAHEGSISKASRTLRIGQPALSIQLKQLEESLDAKLFERKAQRLKLTPIGKTVLEYADAIFNLGTELLETVKERRSTDFVRLDLGVLDSVPKFVAHQMAVSAIESGHCYLSVSEAGNDELLQGLLNHRLHLILTNSHAPLAPKSDLVSRCVGDLPVIIVGSPKFHKLQKAFPQSLAGQPFLLPTAHSKLRNDLEHFFDRTRIHPRIIGESQDSEFDKQLALSGHALIAISRQAVANPIRAKTLIRLGEIKSVREQIWLTGIRRHLTNPIASDLLDTFVIH